MSGFLVSSFILGVLTLTNIKFAECLICYECNGVRNVSDCHTTVTCGTDQICYTDTTGKSSDTRHTLGCRQRQTCRQGSSTPGALIGRAVTDNLVCSQCCGVDLCNRHICSSEIHGVTSSQCADDPSFNCQQVSALFDVCNDRDHAKLVCQKFCALCDIVDGFWLGWSTWSGCSETCGNGVLTRTRTCNRTTDGLPCSGDSFESQPCFIKTCPVNGGWSIWTSWSTCSVTCGAGFNKRERQCSNPYPGPNGHFCVGASWDVKVCLLTSCSDGVWLQWSSWSVCSATCGGGLSTRRRQCNTSTLSHICVGHDEENEVCNSQLCPGSFINGGWTVWSSWTPCSPYCMTERTRSCSNPAPSTHGQNCLGNPKETRDCNLEYCSHPVRLVNGPDPYEGRLEVFFNGEWGTVCDDSFDNKAADVVCRMLNYKGIPTSYQAAAYGPGNLSIILDDVVCTGFEQSLFECKHLDWGKHNCGHSEDVGVSCHANLTARLVNGTSHTNGRVEVSRGNNDWRAVCDYEFDNIDAGIVCKMLSLPSNKTIVYTGGHYGYGKEPSFVTDVACQSSDSTLSNCGHFAEENGNCNSTRSVGIACVNKIDVRLANGSFPNRGRVEVSIDGGVNWGIVCYNLNKVDAAVICRSLGLPTNITLLYGSSFFGQGPFQPVLSKLGCSGGETSVIGCNVGIENVPPSCNDVGVSCNTNMYVRLVNGTASNNGRVEVSLDGGSWGPVCDTSFNSNTAKVVCRMLGLSTNTALPYGGAYFGQGTGTYSIDRFVCNGNEKQLAECSLYPYSCGDNRAAGVMCDVSTHINVRLVNGTSSSNGRVELSLDGGNWGPICHLNDNTARVICRTMGLPTNLTLQYDSSYFGQGTAESFFSYFGCSGRENTLHDCTYGLVRPSTYCNNFGVSCNTNMNVRLVNGTSSNNGRVEVSIDGSTWGPICSLNTNTASLICRTLGLPTNLTLIYPDAYFGSGGLPLLGTGGISCSGSEHSLNECTLGFNRPCGQHKEVGLACTSFTGLTLRLTNGSSSHSGRVEITLDGGNNWGTVCDDNFDNMAARVVCKMLGLPWSKASYYTAGGGSGPILLANVRCTGLETSIADCNHPLWGVNYCRHYEDVGVRCA